MKGCGKKTVLEKVASVPVTGKKKSSVTFSIKAVSKESHEGSRSEKSSSSACYKYDP